MSMQTMEAVHPLYGMMAEFETPTELVEAARRVREAGFKHFDAYSPYPIHELDEAMDLHDNRVSLFTLIGGIIGGCTGFGLCSWVGIGGFAAQYRRAASDQRTDVYPHYF